MTRKQFKKWFSEWKTQMVLRELKRPVTKEEIEGTLAIIRSRKS